MERGICRHNDLRRGLTMPSPVSLRQRCGDGVEKDGWRMRMARPKIWSRSAGLHLLACAEVVLGLGSCCMAHAVGPGPPVADLALRPALHMGPAMKRVLAVRQMQSGYPPPETLTFTLSCVYALCVGDKLPCTTTVHHDRLHCQQESLRFRVRLMHSAQHDMLKGPSSKRAWLPMCLI